MASELQERAEEILQRFHLARRPIVIAEKILHTDLARVAAVFATRTTVMASDALKVIDLFKEGGKFASRDLVEGDASSVQALPVVVVRNKSGEVLRLRRREKDDSSSLHHKLVIWAGGHVREEDAHNGEPLSGKFVGLDLLAQDIDSGEIKEPWSTEIIRQLLPGVVATNQGRLF
jgi:hypothetical protein